jgi:ubiquinone/menaquinone biosynthesis C-methylase UbiE
MDRFARMALGSRKHAASRIAGVDGLLVEWRPPAGGAALEIGCGAGFVSAHVAEKYGLSVQATDADDQMLELARRKSGAGHGVTFSKADAGKLPFADASFDLVIAQNVFHHVPDWRAAADEVARVMRPEGLFVFADGTGPSESMKMLSRADKSHGFQDTDKLVDRMALKGIEVVSGGSPALSREFAMLFKKS